MANDQVQFIQVDREPLEAQDGRFDVSMRIYPYNIEYQNKCLSKL